MLSLFYYLPPQHLSHLDKACISQLKGSPVSGLQQLVNEILPNSIQLQQHNKLTSSNNNTLLLYKIQFMKKNVFWTMP